VIAVIIYIEILTFPISAANDKNLNITENLRETRRTPNCCC